MPAIDVLLTTGLSQFWILIVFLSENPKVAAHGFRSNVRTHISKLFKPFNPVFPNLFVRMGQMIHPSESTGKSAVDVHLMGFAKLIDSFHITATKITGKIRVEHVRCHLGIS